MFQRLLVPLDGSRLAEVVLPLVERMASRLGADVELLHVIERGAPARIHGDRHLREDEEARAYLFDNVAPRLTAAGLSVHAHVHDVPEGDVAASIAGHASELGADLIVLATHGSGGMRDILFGSVAQQVLARTTVPVLLVRPDSAAPGAMQRFLVPLDGTAEGEEALPAVVELAQAFGGEALLLRVVPTWTTVGAERAPGAVLLPSATAAALEVQARAAEDYVGAVASRLAGTGVRAVGEVRRGDPARAILEAARARGVDLTVMATHGRAGLMATWAGSLAARLIKSLPVPVLLVRAEAPVTSRTPA